MQPYENNAHENQRFFYAEIGYDNKGCERPGVNFETIESPQQAQSEFKMTEYSVQLENGVLNTLDGAIHYTYSVWPDSTIK